MIASWRNPASFAAVLTCGAEKIDSPESENSTSAEVTTTGSVGKGLVAQAPTNTASAKAAQIRENGNS